MKSRTTARFRALFHALPRPVQENARAAYRRFVADPLYPGLRFKQVHLREPIYSVRIGRGYRAVGMIVEDAIIWYWIGSHADYDRLLQQR